MNTVDQLRTQYRTLQNSLNGENHDKVVKQLREIDKQISHAKRLEKLDRVNREQERKRANALKAWEAEQPTEDITTNDGSLHKTKAKKYPKLAAIEYVRAEWKDGRITTLRVEGERFQMYKTKYEYNQPTQYTRPETFEEFLELNGIHPQPVTMGEYLSAIAAAERAKDELKEAIAKYKRSLEGVDKLRYLGLFGQQPEHLYITEE